MLFIVRHLNAKKNFSCYYLEKRNRILKYQIIIGFITSILISNIYYSLNFAINNLYFNDQFDQFDQFGLFGLFDQNYLISPLFSIVIILIIVIIVIIQISPFALIPNLIIYIKRIYYTNKKGLDLDDFVLTMTTTKNLCVFTIEIEYKNFLGECVGYNLVGGYYNYYNHRNLLSAENLKKLIIEDTPKFFTPFFLFKKIKYLGTNISLNEFSITYLPEGGLGKYDIPCSNMIDIVDREFIINFLSYDELNKLCKDNNILMPLSDNVIRKD